MYEDKMQTKGGSFAYKVAWVLLAANTWILSILWYMLPASLKYTL